MTLIGTKDPVYRPTDHHPMNSIRLRDVSIKEIEITSCDPAYMFNSIGVAFDSDGKVKSIHALDAEDISQDFGLPNIPLLAMPILFRKRINARIENATINYTKGTQDTATLGVLYDGECNKMNCEIKNR